MIQLFNRSAFTATLWVALLLATQAMFAQQSPLANGTHHKLRITQDGLYKITPEFLAGLGQSAAINPRSLHIYGLGGGMLPQANSTLRYKGIQELPLYFSGNQNDVFETGEYFLFYAEGADKQVFDPINKTFRTEKNVYATANFYFLSVSANTQNQLMETQPFEQVNNSIVVSSYHDYKAHENDLYSILLTPSGRYLYGEQFNTQNTYTFQYNDLEVLPSTSVKLVAGMVASSYQYSSFNFLLNGTEIGEMFIESIIKSAYERKGVWQEETYQINSSAIGTSSANELELTINYFSSVSGSVGYLDYISLNWERPLSYHGKPLRFRNHLSLNFEGIEYQVNNVPIGALLFDITDPVRPFLQQVRQVSNQNIAFARSGQQLREYLLVEGNNFPAPAVEGTVASQNLLGLATPQMLIITAPSLLAEAQRLADFRLQHDGITSAIVTTQQIFNEFSSGRQDVTAIRDYVRHLYLQGGLQYLLLFGEGSHDYLDRYPNNINLVPVYESRESMHPVRSYSSDDFYGLLEEGEGEWLETFGNEGKEDLDIGIGRIPVGTASEAKGVVDKIIHYSQQTSTYGAWRKKVLFVADDGDGNVHQDHAEQLAKYIEANYPKYLAQRLYIDAYPKEATANSPKAPFVRNSLAREVENGVLILNYSGHGSETGWAGENILDIGVISSWQNLNKPALMMTATCEFGRHDDPERRSGAEYALINPHGGAIALLTTTRPVYANTNLQLNRAFYAAVFAEEATTGVPPRIGDVFRITKNNAIAGVVNRNFSLLGDPSMRLAYPTNEVKLTQLNGHPISLTDTLKALRQVTFEGEIRHLGALKTDFNGIVNVTVFDKPDIKYTLGIEEDSYPMPYSTLESVLFQGQVSISNGAFSFTFVVPKDINYIPGKGKISLYAYDTTTYDDALGELSELIIGGSSANVPLDLTPPEIDAYLNDQAFTSGQMVSPNPVLYASFFDESGINTTGIGIGHDILATLTRNGQQEEFLLNNYFETEINSYQKGHLAFPFSNLYPGKYTLTLTAWDTHNNVAERQLSFEVEGSGQDIDLVKIYPNPAIEQVTISLVNRRAGELLQINWSMIDQHGKIVHSQTEEFASGPSTLQLQWNRSRALPSGLYFCRLVCSFPGEKLQFAQYLKVVVID